MSYPRHAPPRLLPKCQEQPFLAACVSLIHRKRKLSIHTNKGVQQASKCCSGMGICVRFLLRRNSHWFATAHLKRSLAYTNSDFERGDCIQFLRVVSLSSSIKRYYRKTGLHSASKFLTHLEKEICKFKLPHRKIILECWCYICLKSNFFKSWNQLHVAWTLLVWSASWLTWAISG